MHVKKRLVRIGVVLIGALLVGLVIRELARPPEPVYQGKSVRAWIEELSFTSGLFAPGIGLSARPMVNVTGAVAIARVRSFIGRTNLLGPSPAGQPNSAVYFILGA